MLNFNSILVFSENPKKLSDFYNNVFQKKPDWSDGHYYGYAMGAASIVIGPHDKVRGKSMNPERIMINLESADVLREFERIKALGSIVIAEPYKMGEESDMWIATFADPDGNYFQLGSPMTVQMSEDMKKAN